MKVGDRLVLVRDKLKDYRLPHEIEEIEQYIIQIHKVKEKKNAIILGHNYMPPEIYYGLSDFTGDSFGLSLHAAQTDADIILFNGVHFMAETAKILNPQKKVLIADKKAGCSLAESIRRDDVKKLKKEYPGAPVISYINCSAEVKAESDIICTSANAVKVIQSVDSERVIMLPDEYLADNIQKEVDKTIISWKGKCMVHELFTKEDIQLAKRTYNDIQVISHPECQSEVTQVSDFTGSTSQIGAYIQQAKPQRVMLLTECSMGENLKVDFPEIEFVASCQNCPHMKKITLKKILDCLEEENQKECEVHLPESLILEASQPLNRMLEIGL